MTIHIITTGQLLNEGEHAMKNFYIKNHVHLECSFVTYKGKFEVIFQKQIEIESKDQQRLAIVSLLKGKDILLLLIHFSQTFLL